MVRVDTNKNRGIDFGEFCALAQSNSDLEKVRNTLIVFCAFFIDHDAYSVMPTYAGDALDPPLHASHHASHIVNLDFSNALFFFGNHKWHDKTFHTAYFA